MSDYTIEAATARDLDDVVALFEGYRAFYGCAPQAERARDFIAERIARGESTVFLARSGARADGFVQLFPMFSTLRLARTWILEDLFVAPHARRAGVGRALLERAERFARTSGADALSLTTAVDNLTAQRLYVAAGWTRNEEFFTYHRALA